MIWVKASFFTLSREQVKILSVRFSFGFPAWLFNIVAVAYLQVGLVQTLFNLIPLLTLIFAFIILKETIPRPEIINIFICFLGVLVVVYGSPKSN